MDFLGYLSIYKLFGVEPDTFGDVLLNKKDNVYGEILDYEKALYDIGLNLHDHYGNVLWYVTINGMGVMDEEQFMVKNGIVIDDYRISFIKDHLMWLHKAIEEGYNCFGYHLWKTFNCWSWRNAYKNRYGFVRVYIKDGCKTSMKKFGRWFRREAENYGFIK